MRTRFINRDRELRGLARLWEGDRPAFVVLTGRRRIGKSRLLEEFFRDKPALHIVGTAQTQRVQLADASRELARVTGDPLLGAQTLDSWEALLAYLAVVSRDRPFGLIIDEFSYYVDQAPELPSLLQRWWDRTGSQTSMRLVLASSHATFMDRLLAGDQPLFGRRTADLRLTPLDYADASRFFPAYAAVDRLRAYGVFGGMPAYLAACDPALPLLDNIRSRVLEPDAYLRREPIYLLAQERSVKQPAIFLSILRAVAAGSTQPNAIAQETGLRTPADIAPHLERLREFGLLERLVPVTAEPMGRISRYIVADPFVAFWFRFVQPAEALLERGLADHVLKTDLHPTAGALDHFISRPNGPWERACADYLWRALGAGLLGRVRFEQLGPWWHGRGSSDSVEIDLVGRQGRHTTLLASCKWRNEWMKIGDLNELLVAGARVGADEETAMVLFSRSGFDPSLVARAAAEGVWLVTPEGMLAPSFIDAAEQ